MSFISSLSPQWTVKNLSFKDEKDIQNFLNNFDDFFEMCEGVKGTAKGLLNACPSSRSIKKHKLVLGVFENTHLIALIDIIKNFPKNKIWTIGYFLVHPNYRTQKIGSRFLDDFKKTLNSEDIQKLRCAVQQKNPRALSFWQKNNFIVVSEITEKLGNNMNKTYILESDLCR